MSDIYVGSLFSGSYLEHHGILGMKWGVRHKNYPLDPSEHTAAEKKAGYKKSISGNGKESKNVKKRGSLKGAGYKETPKKTKEGPSIGQRVGEASKGALNKAKAGAKEGAARAYDSTIGKYAQNNVAYWDRKNSFERGWDNLKAASRRKTLSGKMSELAGAGAKKRYYQNEANYQRALANKAYRSNKNKAEAERNARNSESQAKYFDSVNKGKTRDTLRGRFNIPYEKANGKTTTRGKQYISDVGKRAVKQAAVSVGKKALGAALVYAANKAANSASNQNYRVLEVQTLEDFSRRKR